MKTTATWLVLAATTAALHGNHVDAQEESGFSPEEQALWIDRHNYFRMTALPFAAGNMLRMKWSAALAATAAADAKTCAAQSGAGINAHVHAPAAGDNTPIIDHAFKQWVVAPAMASFAKLTAPKAAGEPVGTGMYNTYSQVVWSSTNEVGCARAACSGGKIGVVCRYAPAGNDGTSPWYTHAPAGTACPEGLVSKVGLCIVEGDAGFNDIAPIPAGSNAYDVYKDFIPSMQKALAGQAVAPPADTPAVAPVAGGSGSKTSADDEGPGKVKPSSGSGSFINAPKKEPQADVPASSTGSAAAGGATTAPATGGASTPTAPEGGAGAPANGDAAPAPADGGAAPAPAQAAGLTPAEMANNKSSQDDKKGGFSAAGIAGVIVVGCVLIAGVAVFVSYNKNQQRQRDIMQNGGIHVL